MAKSYKKKLKRSKNIQVKIILELYWILAGNFLNHIKIPYFH